MKKYSSLVKLAKFCLAFFVQKLEIYPLTECTLPAMFIFHKFPLTYKRGERISSTLLTLSPRFQLHLTSDADAITTISVLEISEIEQRTTVLENLKGDRLK